MEYDYNPWDGPGKAQWLVTSELPGVGVVSTEFESEGAARYCAKMAAILPGYRTTVTRINDA